jgi:60 kDa SS-A/Ro ribonucleoprotein
MPIGALVRNLSTMTRVGLITPTSSATRLIRDRLSNEEAVRRSKIHPVQVLSALKTYSTGVSMKGTSSWTPVAQIVDALDELFYTSFGNVPATGKSRMIALDVSGSMFRARVLGFDWLNAAEAAAVMAMVSVHTGDPYEVVAFTAASTSTYQRGYGERPRSIFDSPNGGRFSGSHGLRDALSTVNLSERQRLDDVLRLLENDYAPHMGGTDCALPMLYAAQEGREVDLFEIMTDNETWAGDIHPSQALQKYREASGRDARLAVIATASNGFSIADPQDSGMLDVVGFDTNTPSLLSAFAEGGF